MYLTFINQNYLRSSGFYINFALVNKTRNIMDNLRIGDTVKIIDGDKRNIDKIAIITGFMDMLELDY